MVRTKTALSAIMAAANREGVVMAADGRGSFIWPEFQPVVDGMMTVAKILEYLAVQETHLSEVLAEVPPFFMAQGVVSCPWEHKGTVMRLLNQQYKDRMGPNIDGVKILLGEDEWVLVLPDEDQPRFQIFAEGRSDAHAHDLVQRYERIVEGLQQ